MKQLMTGDEAVARGAYEAGVHFASAYPGTPSTEIMENLASYPEIKAEWAPNEKVAAEAAIGASIAGGRSMASMKHVGVNVAADPIFTFAYTGVNGGMVLVSADEPGMHSSQNEQDNRNYAKAARIAMLEPSDSQECKDMARAAFDLSERFDTPVMLRLTTRVCHSKGIVECAPRKEAPIKPYVKNVDKYVTVPAHSRVLRYAVEKRTEALREYSNNCEWNRTEYNPGTTGVIASGVACCYAKEVFGDSVSYLKLGFTWPLPDRLITEFCEKMETVYIIEENDPYIEDEVRRLGFHPHGRDTFPFTGELMPDVIRQSVYGSHRETIEYDKAKVLPRPPMLCAGCPHRGFFYELGKLKNVMFAGDIGCYTLASAPPYNALDFNICMGASLSAGHGAQTVFDLNKGCGTRVVAVLGDSTFFHTGIPSLIEVAYNNSNSINVILDNRITGMTGHQENPGSGYNAKGEPAAAIDLETVVRACGIKNVRVVNPNDLAAVRETLSWALSLDAPSVIITRWPCVLKRFSKEDREEFPDAFKTRVAIDPARCIGCKICLKCGCPALSYSPAAKQVVVDRNQCVGCGVCSQICPKSAIVEEEKAHA